MKFAYVILAALVAISLSVAATTVVLGTVQDALSSLCTQAKSLLPVTAMLMLVMGGVIYAAGQLLGAETRARANVWATACLTGALIAILMVVVAPPVLQMIYADQGTIGCEVV
jgi:Na+-driven multidrug efflux pump